MLFELLSTVRNSSNPWLSSSISVSSHSIVVSVVEDSCQLAVSYFYANALQTRNIALPGIASQPDAPARHSILAIDSWAHDDTSIALAALVGNAESDCFVAVYKVSITFSPSFVVVIKETLGRKQLVLTPVYLTHIDAGSPFNSSVILIVAELGGRAQCLKLESAQLIDCEIDKVKYVQVRSEAKPLLSQQPQPSRPASSTPMGTTSDSLASRRESETLHVSSSSCLLSSILFAPHTDGSSIISIASVVDRVGGGMTIAFGTETGFVHLACVKKDKISFSWIISSSMVQFEGPISLVRLFWASSKLSLLAACAAEAAFVFRDVHKNSLSRLEYLPNSDVHDAIISGSVGNLVRAAVLIFDLVAH